MQNVANQLIEKLGSKVYGRYTAISELQSFLVETFKNTLKLPLRRELIFQQMYFIGNGSISIIVACGFFIGVALSLQLGSIFVIFGAEGMLGGANGKGLTREMGPLITGFLLAGRAGASIAAEIATMKVNEQIDAMEAMAVDPIDYLVVPRLIASSLVLPVLTMIFNVSAMLSTLLVSLTMFGVDQGGFVDKIRKLVVTDDLWAGLEKSLLFGAVIALVSCYYGLRAGGGAKGVGEATTKSVVGILLALLGVDLVMTIIQVFVL